MRIGDAIIQILSTAAGVSQYVYDEVAQKSRIFPLMTGADQPEVYPLITYQRMGGRSLQSLSSASGLGYQRMMIKCYVDNNDYDTLCDMTDQVRLALEGYQNLSTGIAGIMLDREPQDGYDEGARVMYSDLEIIVAFQESQVS